MSRSTEEQAAEAIRIIASALESGEAFLTYGTLEERLGRPGQGRLIGPVLNAAARRCLDGQAPDISAVVCTAKSTRTGMPMPSEGSFGSGGIQPISGFSQDDIRAEQERVRQFDWKSWISRMDRRHP